MQKGKKPLSTHLNIMSEVLIQKGMETIEKILAFLAYHVNSWVV